jgi:hypothetical protein
MARVKQFADDLGISKNQAQSLINKGRSRKDGGSQILENVMKPKGYLAGGSVLSSTKKDSKAIKKTTKKKKKDEEYMIDRELTLDELLSNKRNLDLDKTKKDGGTLKMRGGGIAVQGLGFKGVR